MPPRKPSEPEPAAARNRRDEPAPAPAPTTINVNLNVSSPMLAALVEMVESHFQRQEKQMASIRKDLDRLRKALDAAKTAEEQEDADAATLKTTLETRIAELQAKVENETISEAERTELEGMIAEAEAMGGITTDAGGGTEGGGTEEPTPETGG